MESLNDSFVQLGDAMRKASVALTEFGAIYGAAVEAELSRLRAVRQANPRPPRLGRR